MLDRRISAEVAVHLLDLASKDELDEAVSRGELGADETQAKGKRFRLGDILSYELAKSIRKVGVSPEKSAKYAEAVLRTKLFSQDESFLEWMDDESQELICQIADNQLARVFVRNKEDDKEVDLAAVKPVLLPTTKCEINVFRVIGPLVYRARKLGPAK